MALQTSPEKVTCSICLEVYKKPVTTACGHTFCTACIEQHWDKAEQAKPGAEVLEGIRVYNCPQCRRVAPLRPRLSTNVVLTSIIDDLPLDCSWQAEACDGAQSAEPQLLVHLPATPPKGAPALCARHRRPLELYCISDQCCICCECSVRECREHPRAMPDEQRVEKEKILEASLLETKALLQSTEESLSQTEEKTKRIQENSDKFVLGISELFATVHRTLEECQVLSQEVLKGVTRAALDRAESNLAQLQSQRDARAQYLQRAEQLLACKDDVSFLQGFPLLSSPAADVALPAVVFPITEKVAPIQEILSQVRKLLRENLVNSLYVSPISGETKESPVKKALSVVKPRASCLPEGELRSNLRKDHRKLTFDPNTAYRCFKLSSRDQRLKHTTSPNEEKPDHPDRFLSWQVLCRESFQEGSHYWEVDLSDEFAYIGVAYSEIDRKKKNLQTCRIGRNAVSWSLQVQPNYHIAWHDGLKQKVEAPLYRCVGLHLDCASGTIALYGVGEKMELLHTFQCVFTAPVYPAFWVGEGVEICLL